MSTSQIISVLSANRFLTQNEIERTLGYSLSKSEIAFLKASPKIVLFNFYGRIYYKLIMIILSPRSKEDKLLQNCLDVLKQLSLVKHGHVYTI